MTPRQLTLWARLPRTRLAGSGLGVGVKTIKAYVRERLTGYPLRQRARADKRNGSKKPQQLELFG